MAVVDIQIKELQKLRDAVNAKADPVSNNSFVITIPDFILPEGWEVPNRPDRKVDIIFLAPPGYPGSQPDCFWVKPIGIRLTGGQTPQNSNDSTVIPGVPGSQPPGTWFSWHVQRWNPNSDSLVTYFKVIKNRLIPPR